MRRICCHPSSLAGNTYNPDAATPSSSLAGGRCSSQQLQNCSWRLLFSLQDQVSLPIAITRHPAHYRNDVASSHPYRQKAHKGVQATPVGPIPRCQGELEKAQGYRQQSAWSFVRLAGWLWHGMVWLGWAWIGIGLEKEQAGGFSAKEDGVGKCELAKFARRSTIGDERTKGRG